MPQTAAATAETTAAPDLVFAHLAVAEAWPRWLRLPSRARRVQDGAPDANGVGAVRSIFPVRERVVAFEPGVRYAYIMVSPSPIRFYRADVRLTPKDGGTSIEYAAQGDPLIPGTGPLIRGGLRAGTRLLARLLARHTAACPDGCPARTAG